MQNVTFLEIVQDDVVVWSGWTDSDDNSIQVKTSHWDLNDDCVEQVNGSSYIPNENGTIDIIEPEDVTGRDFEDLDVKPDETTLTSAIDIR